MNVLIIEDEPLAAANLREMLRSLRPQFELVGILETVAEATALLSESPPGIDLAFCDVHLGDGSSFSIFEEVPVHFPIIFTTAYDEYALKAFSVNSIDYLLKPIQEAGLQRALDKFDRSKAAATTDPTDLSALLQQFVQKDFRQYRQSFLVSFRNRLIPVAVTDFQYFYILGDLVYGQRRSGPRYQLDETLETLEAQLDPEQFFRANRQLIVRRQAIAGLQRALHGKYKLLLHQVQEPPNPDPIGRELVKTTVSKARGPVIKQWLSR
ncbi:LytTR family DNA-binding domain-containing protein [Lewinella sp. W8]|uniref:LytR/AlgR family response regulator transcription factor n=1 Tax=Lewinella sp. W8 TaxID=2528208 RepID=UPI001067ED08|nr:LytTR family DNA-binding domain-containing protein [Lewinella sp. W8]MTB49880.1 response regulator [Lewinella sp. W8]